MRKRELRRQERELEMKEKKAAAFKVYDKPKKPIMESQSSKPSPRFEENPLRKSKEDINPVEEPTEEVKPPAEIPQNDQVLLNELELDKAVSSKIINELLTDIDEKLKNALKSNVIIMEFNSIREKPITFPEKIAFSLQFYTFPLIRTELAIIENTIEKISLLKFAGSVKNWTNSLISSGDTLKIQFEVDPVGEDVNKSFMEFVNYLNENTCKIWIWNAITQIMIGYCNLPLIDLVRVEESSKMIKKECSIYLLDDDNSMSGKLCLSLYNNGRKDTGGTFSKISMSIPIKESNFRKRGKLKIKSKPITAQELSTIPKTNEKTSLVYAYKEYTLNHHKDKPWEREGLYPEYEKYRMYSRTISLAGMVDVRPQNGLVYTLGKVEIYPVKFVNKYAREMAFEAIVTYPV